MQAGNPEELVELLNNWLRQANDPIGSLPEGGDPTEWAVRQFIKSWQKPIRSGLDSVDGSLESALQALKAGDIETATFEIGDARQTLGEDVRGELGLHPWNEDLSD